VTLVVDTGSQWTTVIGDECLNCDAAVFDPTLSTSYLVVDPTSTIKLSYNKRARV